MTRRREPVLTIDIPTPPIVHEVIPHRGTRQAIKFALVGAIVFAIDAAVFLFLLGTPLAALGQLGKQLGKAASFLVATGSSYLGNRIWTFRSSSRDISGQASRFALVAFVGLFLNNGFFYLFNAPELLGLDDLWALLAASLSAGLWNFLVQKYWTFQGH